MIQVGVAAFSGLLWGLLGAYLTSQIAGSHSWFAAPGGIVIGLLVFYSCRWTYRRPLWILLPTAFVSTFFAVALFGLCLGVADVMRDIPNRIGWAVVMQSMNACLWGLAFSPPYWLLFLLSFGNHALLRYHVIKDAEPVGGANDDQPRPF